MTDRRLGVMAANFQKTLALGLGRTDTAFYGLASKVMDPMKTLSSHVFHHDEITFHFVWSYLDHDNDYTVISRRCGNDMSLDDEAIIEVFLCEALDHLTNTEQHLLALETGGADACQNHADTIFRSVHSIKGGAGFVGLQTIGDLSHSLENVLDRIRNGLLTPSSLVIDVMLGAADALRMLFDNIAKSNEIDVSSHIDALNEIVAMQEATEQESQTDPFTAAEPATDRPKSPSASETSTTESSKGMQGSPNETSVNDMGTPNISSSAGTTIRVPIELLDGLMNLAGELVLGRNQLLQAIESKNEQELETIGDQLDLITSGLQESIMLTRMQPVATIFEKFHRFVRDLGNKHGKQVELIVKGKEVELDKSIIEAIADPIQHLIRNSLDHGIESKEERIANGKDPSGSIVLEAHHRAGKVLIVVRDDGAGIDTKKIKDKALAEGLITEERAQAMSERDAQNLVFHPGFSTAEEITDLSGRGVGMDVVKTNIEELGGTIEIESQLGIGTSVELSMPLTLAIIPALVIGCGDSLFAISQVNISEVVRIKPNEVAKRIERVKDSEVLRLRGSLLPLVRLNSVLNLQSRYKDVIPNESRDDLRMAIADRRVQGSLPGPNLEDDRSSLERRRNVSGSVLNIIVIEVGYYRYGLIVDELYDSLEIVVKPLGRHLKNCPCTAGATILGDGSIALILDVAGVASYARLATRESVDTHEETVETGDESSTLLIFSNDPNERFAIPAAIVSRLESIETDEIETVADQEFLQYRGTSLPLISLEKVISAKPREPNPIVYIVVSETAGKEVGLLVAKFLDNREVRAEIDTITFREKGVSGSLIIDGELTRLIDLSEIVETMHPEWVE